MRDFTTTIINKYNSIIRVLMVLAAIALISLLFTPRSFDYDFEMGKPWRYDNLYAPFLFTIDKASESVEEERRAITSEFLPYYSFEKKVGLNILNDFERAFKSEYDERLKKDSLFYSTVNRKDHFVAAEKVLIQLYEKGVVEKTEMELGQEFPDKFNLLRGNVSEVKKFSEFSDLREANLFLVSSLQKQKNLNSEFLLDVLQNGVQANIVFDDKVSSKLLEGALSEISSTRGVVQEQEGIIKEGEIVSPEKFQVLNSLREAQAKQLSTENTLFQRFGHFFLIALIIGAFLAYIQYYNPKIVKNPRQLAFILSSIVVVLYLVKGFMNFEDPRLLYLFPFCIVPIVFRNFFGGGVAIFSYVVLLLITSFLIPWDFEFIVIQFVAGLIAVIISARTFYWSQFFTSAAAIFVTYVLMYLSTVLIHSGKGLDFDGQIVGAFGVNALLSLLAFPLIPLFERLFGFVSNISLVEMGDLNKPLLKNLSQRAPGTFWHSLQVANLAESVARELGANELLSKVGALYHDIGKMENPGFFIENLENEVNPHDRLEPVESARIIINHVKAGIIIAKEYGLPNVLIDFIRTHHGKTHTVYFLEKEKQRIADTDEELDDNPFTYPGPLPFSKESAIVMMADSIEAASRTLNNPSKEDIDNLVNKIIQQKVDLNQFVNCDLSFKDLNIARKVFQKTLKSKYHIRVSYPDQKKIG